MIKPGYRASTPTNSTHPDLTLLWIAADQSAAIGELARKLPHYRKYSWCLKKMGSTILIKGNGL
ncbi:hypothetical protein NSMM_490003 [Nitrosomonas mobilis]|uniref:Uncharacterized protein n=1 Tax=Nitrosomonas mobilis TaxID=51642 RepID=A0A1G5SFZ6_9PROT|nr:hypothetical protein NSMM_490003 [Nitrosomonas mobilis]